ncbi:MAG: hypothetical protein WBW04_20935 [Nitrolancea sp.]
MSQVSPPRTRQSKHRPETINILRAVLINAGTLVVTGLLLRIAILISVPTTTERGLHVIERLTLPAVWPFQRIPPLAHQIIRELTVADVLVLTAVIVAWIVALGIVAGWEHEEQRQRPGTSETGLRP